MIIIHKKRGSIMLISILIVSAVLLILTLGASETQISSSYQQLNSSSNKSTYYYAESCYEEAARKLKTDSSYGGETVIFNDGNCEITVVGADTKTITISTTFSNYTQNYEAQVSIQDTGEINNVRLLNWEKI